MVAPRAPSSPPGAVQPPPLVPASQARSQQQHAYSRPEPPGPSARTASQPAAPKQPLRPRRPGPDSSSDPLARLPSLEAVYDDDDAHDTSGTHVARDLAESGEMGGTDPSGPPLGMSDFDEMPTEVVRKEWEDETMRRPLEAAAAYRRTKGRPNPRQPSAPSIEDTVKIEGDIEAHFARMHPEDKPRPPRRRR
jgi:hypothetical protein